MSFLLKTVNKVNDTFRQAGSFNSDIGMFSGFTPLDILASNFEKAENLDVDLLNGGLFNNPYNQIGLSAVGKTTLWIQVISACIDNWNKYYGPVSECVFYNIENHTSPARWQAITGYDDTKMRDRIRFVSKSYSIVEIYNEIAVLAKVKLQHQKDLEIDTGVVSIDGGTVKTLPTTYVLVDSIAAVRTKTELEFDKDGNVKSTNTVAGTNNMDAMQIAKDNTMFINEVKKLCEDAKICVILINHLVEVPVLDRYNPPKPILPGMKFNQKLKGGGELVYQSFGVGMLSIKERLFNDKQKVYGDSVHGLIAFMDWLKNKNGPEGIRYPMVFDSATGYKPELTDFEILYSENQYGIKGSPMSYRLSILPEITFTRKTLLNKCHENPLLARAMGFTTRYLLIQKVLFNKTVPDSIDDLEDLPFETRVDLILRYSIDYPGYVNNGWVVDDEILAINEDLSFALGRTDRWNINLSQAELDLLRLTNGGLIFHNKTTDCFSEEVTIGKTQYTVPNADIDDWSSIKK